MEKIFKLKENGTNVKTEIIAGVTTFLAMAYILAVNPSILSAAGMDPNAIFAATAVSAAFATLIMAFYANYPVVLASGMGLNAYFAYTVVPQLAEQGIYERIIVRPIPESEDYEILAGHNRTEAWRLTGHTTIPAEVVNADDARAVSIAVATNLLRRQDLTIIERGKAYKAVLDAEKRQGSRTDIGTCGENRQKFLTREIVADFFGVTEYEIRKAIKLAGLIPPLADILENNPRKLPIACAELIADYDAATQQAFVEMCSIEDYTLNKAAMQSIVHACPPPSANHQDIFAAWRQARARETQRRAALPKKISFDRRKFAPYLERLGSDKEIEELFLEFLRQRVN